MKKAYISPTMDVIKIMSQRMLADSNKIPTSGDDVSDVILNPNNMSGGDGGGAASRESLNTWEEW